MKLTSEEFYELTRKFSKEIETARKVRQLFIRKDIKSVTIEQFYSWWLDQKQECYYCKINAEQLCILFDKLKDKNKRPTRGKTLELERLKADEEYNNINNLALCCYVCNNAKSDFFTHEQFIPIGQAITKVWQKILKESNDT